MHRGRLDGWLEGVRGEIGVLFAISSFLLVIHPSNPGAAKRRILLTINLVLGIRSLYIRPASHRDRFTLLLVISSLSADLIKLRMDLFGEADTCTTTVWTLFLSKIIYPKTTPIQCCNRRRNRFSRIILALGFVKFVGGSVWCMFGGEQGVLGALRGGLSVVLIACPCHILIARPLLMRSLQENLLTAEEVERTSRLIDFWGLLYNVVAVPVGMGILEPVGIKVTPAMCNVVMVHSTLIVFLLVYKARRRGQK